MLEQLAKKYGTDKLEHGYIPYYEKYLPKDVKVLLEFGCYKGASAKMWNEYFPEASIFTFDLFKEFDVRAELNELGITTYKGDTNYIADLEQIEWLCDIIIEDASHNSYDQQFIFIYSMIDLLYKESIYVVEDLHCCENPFYWNKGIDKFEDTFLWLLQNWTPEKGFPENKFLNFHTREYINSIVKDVKLHDNKIAFIFRK
jgi:hypothetical protein